MTARSIAHAKQIKPAGATAKLAQNSALSARREKGICILCCNSGSRPCELGAKQTIFQDEPGGRLQSRLRGSLEAIEIATKQENVRMRENFRGKPRRLKLEQMHMNVYIFKQVSPSLKGPLQLYALHGPMFLFVDRLGFSLSPLGLFPN